MGTSVRDAFQLRTREVYLRYLEADVTRAPGVKYSTLYSNRFVLSVLFESGSVYDVLLELFVDGVSCFSDYHSSSPNFGDDRFERIFENSPSTEFHFELTVREGSKTDIKIGRGDDRFTTHFNERAVNAAFGSELLGDVGVVSRATPAFTVKTFKSQPENSFVRVNADRDPLVDTRGAPLESGGETSERNPGLRQSEPVEIEITQPSHQFAISDYDDVSLDEESVNSRSRVAENTIGVELRNSVVSLSFELVVFSGLIALLIISIVIAALLGVFNS